jgi:ABC-type antimicrobial peptide transport system permease subunit
MGSVESAEQARPDMAKYLLLATLGMFGVMSYTIQRRRHEFAIRLALGAQGFDVLKLVIRQGMSLTLGGVAIGLAGARLFAGVMTGLTYGITATDGQTFLGVALLLSTVALLACVLPAWRASRVDPMVSLRQE